MQNTLPTLKRVNKGRGLAAKQNSRSAHLLDAATSVFLQSGFTRATMTSIAKRAGCSLETLYDLYPDKAGMFLALIERRSTSLLAAVGELSVERELPEALFTFAIEVLATMMRPGNRELHRLVIAEVHTFPQLGQIFWNEGPGRGLSVLTGYLTRKQAQGTIQISSPAAAANVFLSLLLGSLTLRNTLGIESSMSTKRQQTLWARQAVSMFQKLLDAAVL